MIDVRQTIPALFGSDKIIEMFFNGSSSKGELALRHIKIAVTMNWLHWQLNSIWRREISRWF